MDAQIIMAFALMGVSLVAYLRGVEIGGAIPAVVVALPGVLLMGYLNTDEAVLQATTTILAFSWMSISVISKL